MLYPSSTKTHACPTEKPRVFSNFPIKTFPATKVGTYIWFLITGGYPDHCPVTKTEGAYGGGFVSACIITDPFADIFYQINIRKNVTLLYNLISLEYNHLVDNGWLY